MKYAIVVMPPNGRPVFVSHFVEKTRDEEACVFDTEEEAEAVQAQQFLCQSFPSMVIELPGDED